MARKGQFKKGGGRHGGGGHATKARRKASTAIVVVGPRAPARRRSSHPVRVTQHAPAHRRRRKGHGGGGVTIGKLAGVGIVLANVAGTNNGPLGATIYDLVQKVPGAKTFGGAAVAGVGLGLLSKTGLGRGRLGPWLRAAGAVGVIAAALKLGEQGTAFKWLGGEVEDGVMRVR